MSTAGKSILVPVDFEPASLRALDVAREFAGLLGAEVILVHVCQPPAVAYPEVPPVLIANLYQEISSAAKKSLDELASKAGGLRSILREGDPAVETERVIDELHPAMVVMGTHGRRGLKRLLLGSVAEHVIRHSKSPVLTVHAPEGDPTPG